jgi:hypothetical protein
MCNIKPHILAKQKEYYQEQQGEEFKATVFNSQMRQCFARGKLCIRKQGGHGWQLTRKRQDALKLGEVKHQSNIFKHTI